MYDTSPKAWLPWPSSTRPISVQLSAVPLAGLLNLGFRPIPFVAVRATTSILDRWAVLSWHIGSRKNMRALEGMISVSQHAQLMRPHLRTEVYSVYLDTPTTVIQAFTVVNGWYLDCNEGSWKVLVRKGQQ